MRKILLLSAAEKFASNGVRAFLVVYFIKQLGLGVSEALGHTAAILSLNYLLPLFCGYLFDKFPSLRENVRLVIGGLAVLSFVLIKLGTAGFESFISTVLIVTAFLRAAIPIWLKSSLRDGESEAVAFTKMYSYFNWGTMLGTLVIAILGEMIGWNICFFITSGVLLVAAWLAPGEIRIKRKALLALGLSIPTIYGVQSLLSFKYYGEGLLVLMVGALIYLFIYFQRQESEQPIRAWLAFAFLILSHAFFFAIYEQVSTSYTSVVLEKLKELGSRIPATGFQLIDPGLNIVLGELFAQLWAFSKFKTTATNTHLRFGLGFLMMIPGLLALRIGLVGTGLFGFVAVFVGASILFVIGEQMIIPAGFGEVSRVSNDRSRGTLIGIWYLGIAISEEIAGFIGQTLSGGDKLDPIKYNSGLSDLMLFCLGLAVVHIGLVLNRLLQSKAN